MAETVKIVIDADDRGASKTITGVHNAMSKLGSVAKGLAIGGIAVAGAAVAGLTAVLVDSVQAAMEAQEAQAQLAAVIKSTGGAAGVTAEMANDLASSLQKVTRFEDDAVLGAENVLLTFTNINKDIFPDTIMAVADLSTAMDQDLKTSALQLGKALNDPIQGMAALQRVGVQFTEAQKEQIKALVGANDILGAQKLILQELQKEFGGSAKAAGETFAGKLDILNNAIGDVKESIGMALIPVLTEIIDIYGPQIIEWAQKFAEWFAKDGVDAIRGFVKDLEGFVKFVANDVVPGVKSAAEAIDKWLKGAIETVRPIIEAFTNEVLIPVRDTFREIWQAIQDAINKLREWMGVNEEAKAAGGGGSGAGGPNAPLYNDPTKGYYHGNSLPMGGYGNPMTINITVNGGGSPATIKGAVLDALSLARARGMAI